MADWPKFITRDLGDSEADDVEMQRRWQAYDRDMKALIASGGVHQDEDGWWVDDATGDLIGPDPELERPLGEADLVQLRPVAEVLPELAAALKRGRGRPKLDNPKRNVTLRLSADVIDGFKSTGPGWQTRMDEALRAAMEDSKAKRAV